MCRIIFYDKKGLSQQHFLESCCIIKNMNNIERKKTTKQKIIDAYWKLLKSKGKGNVYVTDVARIAKVNRATFYRNFIDVDEVLEEIENNVIERTKEIFYQEFTSENFTSIVEDFIIFDKELFDYYSTLLGYNGDPKFGYKLNKLIEMKTSNTPFFAALPDNERKIVTAMVIGIIKSIYELTKMGEITTPPKQIYNFVLKLLEKGFPSIISEETINQYILK